jgi:hypothetical protein
VGKRLESAASRPNAIIRASFSSPALYAESRDKGRKVFPFLPLSPAFVFSADKAREGEKAPLRHKNEWVNAFHHFFF